MKAIDPLKASRLNDVEFQALLNYTDELNRCSNPESVSDELTAIAFIAMRNAGYKITSISDMKIASVQTQNAMKIIKALRKN